MCFWLQNKSSADSQPSLHSSASQAQHNFGVLQFRLKFSHEKVILGLQKKVPLTSNPHYTLLPHWQHNLGPNFTTIWAVFHNFDWSFSKLVFWNVKLYFGLILQLLLLLFFGLWPIVAQHVHCISISNTYIDEDFKSLRYSFKAFKRIYMRIIIWGFEIWQEVRAKQTNDAAR